MAAETLPPYVIVWGPSKIEEQVRDLWRQGYRPLGGPVPDNPLLYQAMVLMEEPQSTTPPEHEGLPAAWTPDESAALDVLTKAWLAFTAACRPEIVNTVAITRNAVERTPPGAEMVHSHPGRVFTLSGVIVLPRVEES